MFPLKACADVVRLLTFPMYSAGCSVTRTLSSFKSFSGGVNQISARMLPSSQSQASASFPALTSSGTSGALFKDFTLTGITFTQIRTNVRINMPRPKENKRRALGWKHRMSTWGGRRVLMRRILKGRYILSH